MKITTAFTLSLIGLVLSFNWEYQRFHNDEVIKDSSGSVEGTAVLAPKKKPVRFGGGLYGRPASSNSDKAESDSILVVLKGVGSDESNQTLTILNQKNQQFVPSILPVQKGSTVRIQNSDPVYHNVFSLTSPHKFDVGRRPKGEHFDVTFEKAGVFDVFCDIHSNMHAIIYVLPEGTTTWTKIKSGEAFSFTNIPDGDYELSFYALGYKEVTSQIEVMNGQLYNAGTVTLNP